MMVGGRVVGVALFIAGVVAGALARWSEAT